MVLVQVTRSSRGGSSLRGCRASLHRANLGADAPKEHPGAGGEVVGYRGAACPGGALGSGELEEGMRENVLPLVAKADTQGRDAERKRQKGFTSLF